MAYKVFNLIAIATLAILAANQGPAQVNALSVDHHNFARHNVRHEVIAKRQAPTATSAKRRCKVRSTSVAIPAPTSPAEQAPPQQDPSPTPAPSQDAPAPAPSQDSPTPAPSQDAPAPSPSQDTPAPAPSQDTPAPPSNGAKKVGIAWANPNDNELANFMVGKTSAVYTWSPYKPPILNNFPNVDFLPMLWGPKQLDDFYRFVKPGYARYILGFNEPDQGGQSNMDPWYAADLWVQHIQPLKSQGYTLVSPACTNAPAGLQWQRDFATACSQKGCSVDVIATHWYGTDSQNFIDHVSQYHSVFGKEVWVTEFACQNFGGGAQCSNDQIWSFMKTVTDWMDNTSFVGRYFYFGVLHDMGNVNWANQLMNSRGQPNDLGYEYLF
ncbi:glycosyl hydrolase catalytic core-domain-containing protein [Coprinopsis sp. MPI-PUGE-AT-0042]|nr:glycosyl hydrolase catalytic core-domain-containing protein [Coprinopsis sp. MPI-PUGE-AT-0042]